MKKSLSHLLLATLLVFSAVAPAQETPKAEATAPTAEAAAADAPQPATPEEQTPSTGAVLTAADAARPCFLPVVVTAVDGVAVAEGQNTERLDLPPGEHTISGYGGGDPSLCETFAGANASLIPAGGRIGEGSVKIGVEVGKEYTVGVDVRSAEKAKWRIVVWKIKH